VNDVRPNELLFACLLALPVSARLLKRKIRSPDLRPRLPRISVVARENKWANKAAEEETCGQTQPCS